MIKWADLCQRLGIQMFQVKFDLKFGFRGTDHFQNANRVNYASLEDIVVVPGTESSDIPAEESAGA
jgi:hypothetical protein